MRDDAGIAQRLLDAGRAAEALAARIRSEARLAGPRAETALYDVGRNRIFVRLTTGAEIGFARQHIQGLQDASAEDLKVIEVEELGLGIRFPRLDTDLRSGSARRHIGLEKLDARLDTAKA